MPYLLTDLKEKVFDNEPAIFVGNKSADKERPTICALCGQPLGAEGYSSFYLAIPNGPGRDFMIGNGCIKDRVREKEIHLDNFNPKEIKNNWNAAFTDIPHWGRWYGTFLHHSIAKPYVRDKKNAENWDESVLSLPGVDYIMETIDGLRDEGWTLDAEMVLECGNVDLLATHPERGTIVFDWKSDQTFDNHQGYVDQVSKYMAELSEAGLKNISGYILWIRNKKKEYVPFTSNLESIENRKSGAYSPSLPTKCTLIIEMNGGEGVRKKRMIEYSHHRTYGDEVSFYIPPCKPWKDNYAFKYFEASPYRDGERLQPFNSSDAEEGFRVNFICTKRRHSFKMTANWERIRPFPCLLRVFEKPSDQDIFSYHVTMMRNMSMIDEDGNEYVEFDVAQIKNRVHGKIIRAALENKE